MIVVSYIWQLTRNAIIDCLVLKIRANIWKGLMFMYTTWIITKLLMCLYNSVENYCYGYFWKGDSFKRISRLILSKYNLHFHIDWRVSYSNYPWDNEENEYREKRRRSHNNCREWIQVKMSPVIMASEKEPVCI